MTKAFHIYKMIHIVENTIALLLKIRSLLLSPEWKYYAYWLKIKWGASEMAQQVRHLLQSLRACLVPGTHVVEEKDRFWSPLIGYSARIDSHFVINKFIIFLNQERNKMMQD